MTPITEENLLAAGFVKEECEEGWVWFHNPTNDPNISRYTSSGARAFWLNTGPFSSSPCWTIGTEDEDDWAPVDESKESMETLLALVAVFG